MFLFLLGEVILQKKPMLQGLRRHYFYTIVAFVVNAIFVFQILYPTANKGVVVFNSPDFTVSLAINRIANFTNGAFAGIWPITIAALTLLVWYFYKAKVIHIFLTGFIGLILFLSFIYGTKWHEGIIFVFTVFCLWIANQTTPLIKNKPLVIVITLVLSVQVWWNIASSYYDYVLPYNPGKEIAARLNRQAPTGSSIALIGLPENYSLVSYLNKDKKFSIILTDQVLPDLDYVVSSSDIDLGEYKPIMQIDSVSIWKDSVDRSSSYSLYEIGRTPNY
jgi:hypothetical protein